MDSSLGFKVISTGKADARMDDEEVSDGASTGFEIHGSRELSALPKPSPSDINYYYAHLKLNFGRSRSNSYIVNYICRIG